MFSLGRRREARIERSRRRALGTRLDPRSAARSRLWLSPPGYSAHQLHAAPRGEGMTGTPSGVPTHTAYHRGAAPTPIKHPPKGFDQHQPFFA